MSHHKKRSRLTRILFVIGKWAFRVAVCLLIPSSFFRRRTSEAAEALAHIDMEHHEMLTGEFPTQADFEEYKSQYLE